MKPESKLWQKIKKNTPKIQWTRLESWASFGVPDLLGYGDNCGFFMCEMKIARGSKIVFSLGHVKLYESKAIHGLLVDHRETPSLAIDDWQHIERLLLAAHSDA
jgi:hypothetical protein